MPVMTGTEATKEILARAGSKRPAIISLTAYAMAEQREAALAAGCANFLAKPFKQEDLYAMLAQYAPQADGEMRDAA
jgi:CheY-like chemotaxis protein